MADDRPRTWEEKRDFWQERAKQVVAQGRQVFKGRLRGGGDNAWWLTDATGADGEPVNIACAEADDLPFESDEVIELEATPVDNGVSIILTAVANARLVRRAAPLN